MASGRTQQDLERWLGRVPELWLAAEHGALLRDPATASWEPLRQNPGTGWKSAIRPLLEDFAVRAPGSLVEEKTLSLAWHYRLTEPEFGEWLANALATELDQQVSGTELAVLRGKMVVEVRFAWANKGELAMHLLAQPPIPDFVLAIGDDRTDEDLFERLPAEAWTIRVGRGGTCASRRLPGPPAVLDLLDQLARAPVARVESG